jgi:hypothetical protein
MGTLTLGVVADTHIPDRAERLHPKLLERFHARRVDAILHAGDICVPEVLTELEKNAPVHAVRGNRDIFYLRHLPVRRELIFNGISVGLIHGHGNLGNYLLDRLRYHAVGLDIRHFQRRVTHSFPTCQIVIYGHIHYPICKWVNQQLVFNPGSACCPDHSYRPPSAGLIILDDAGGVEGEIFYLE